MTASAAPLRQARPGPPSHLRRDLAVVGLGALFVWAFAGLGLELDRLSDLPARISTILSRMLLPPDWSYLPVCLEAMIVSVQMAWMGTLIGALLSLPLGFLAAADVSGRWVRAVARILLDAIRAVPEIVLAVVIFVPIVGLGPFAGALALGIHAVGTLGKLTADAVEGIDRGPVEATKASGAGSLGVGRWALLPQVLPEIVAFWLYRFEIALRAAAVLGVVGAGGIGTVLLNTLSYRRYEKAGMAVIVVVLATILVDQLSGTVRRRIIEGPGARAGSQREEAILEPELVSR